MTVLTRRREFLTGMCTVASAALTVPRRSHAWTLATLDTATNSSSADQQEASGNKSRVHPIKSPFRVAVINDEISQDFGRACEIASRDFGMEWIELRGMWNKNIVNLDSKEIAETRRILTQYQLRVTDIASPLFKVDWAGAPRSKFSEPDDFHSNFTFDQQDEVLERAIELAKAFQTDRVRCFDFWRLDNPEPYRAAMNEKLLDAVNKAGKKGIILLLENDSPCNTATAAEAAKVLTAVKSRYLMLNGKRRGQRRETLSGWLQSPAQGSNRALPLQRHGEAGRRLRLVAHGTRDHRLGGAVQSTQARWLSLCGQLGNSLGGRRNRGEIVAPELGGYERFIAPGWCAVTNRSVNPPGRRFWRLQCLGPNRS